MDRLMQPARIAILVFAATFLGGASGADPIPVPGRTAEGSVKHDPATPIPADEQDRDGSDDPVEAQPKGAPGLSQIRREFQIEATDPTPLTQFTRPVLPDTSGYTAAALKKKMAAQPAGRVVLGSMLQESGFKSLIVVAGAGLLEFVKRQNGALRAIFVEDGLVELQDFSKTLPPDVFRSVGPGKYLARLPILIRHGAALHIGRSVTELRLSTERGAVLANEGNLYVTGSAITGWSEAGNQPAATTADGGAFRPFIVGWSGSATYVVDSRLSHLGYAASKSGGLSLSTYTRAVPEGKVWGPPTGWLIGSKVDELWTGFYCRSAKDVAVIGNTITNAAMNGLDLHEGSLRALIADNEIHNTRLRHGVLLSGSVSDSWVLRNKSYENALSGIVLDRQTTNIVLAGNLTYKNRASGIVVSESSGNLLLDNLASGNLHHGIRLRNSNQIRIQDSSAVANGEAGISAIAMDLRASGRDRALDPYEQGISLTVVGGQLSGNGTGPISIEDPTRVELYNLDLRTPQRSLGYRFGGTILAFQLEVIDILVNRRQAAVLERKRA